MGDLGTAFGLCRYVCCKQKMSKMKRGRSDFNENTRVKVQIVNLMHRQANSCPKLKPDCLLTDQ
jgi:hypothetical protein